MKNALLLAGAAILTIGAGCFRGNTTPPPAPAPQPAPTTTVQIPPEVSAKADLIRVKSLKPYDRISSPITITGEARGNWYFEASFPVELFDGNGKKLATVIATAQDEWMTTNFVPFSTTLVFEKPPTATGFIVFNKDNPSALPEYDDELRFPVRF